MKNAFLLVCTAMALLLSSCGHNVGMVGIGTGFRAGGGGYGINYGEGLFGTFVTKDGINFKAEIDSTTGFSYDPTTNSYKGIRSISYELPPQITGYAVDFASENPEVAKKYYEALGKYYESKKEIATSESAKPMISEEKSTKATTDISAALSNAISKAKSLVNDYLKTDEAKTDEGKFVCDNGNCTYANLGSNKNLSYQLNAALTLLKYDGYENRMEDTNEYYQTTLEHFVTQLVQYQAKGNAETPLRIKRVTVENGVITDIMYVFNRDGEDREVTCPSCVCL